MRQTPMTRPDCGTELQAAGDKCPHGSSSPNVEREKSGTLMGWLLLIIPLVAVLLMWFWISDLSWGKKPELFLNLVALGTVLSTAILVYAESSKLGFGTKKEGKKPIVYFLGMVLLWPIVYPISLYRRRKKGETKRLVIAIILSLLFSGSYLLLNRIFFSLSHVDQPTDPGVMSAVHDWLARQAIPLRSIEAGSGFDDLAPLKLLFKDVRIVALGEATHGTREFFQFKHRMLEFLVTQMGFTVFAIEASYPDCLPIDDYVMFGKGDADKALAGQGFWTWNTQEVRDLIEWLRRYNSKQPEEKRVHFLGMDMQRYTRAFSIIREYLSKTAPDKLADAEAAMKPLWFDQGQPRTNEAVTSFRRARKKAGPLLDAFGAWFDQQREKLISRSSATDYAIARQHVRILQQYVFINASSVNARYRRRDTAMAGNVRWMFDFLGPETRMVLWAHNEHVQFGRTTAMGSHLRAAFGRAYYALGFDFNEGAFQSREMVGMSWRRLREFRIGPAPEGSIGWVFDRAKQRLSSENFIINLRDAPSQGPVATWLMTSHRSYEIGAGFADDFWPGRNLRPQVLVKTYDGLIFINRTTRARPTATQTDFSGIGTSGR